MEYWKAFVALVLSIWAMWEVKALVINILVNVVIAVAAAIFGKIPNFDLARIGEFLTRKVLPYTLAWAVARAVGEAAGYGWIAVAVWGILQVTLLADLTDSLRRLGIPIPDFFTKTETKALLATSTMKPTAVAAATVAGVTEAYKAGAASTKADIK